MYIIFRIKRFGETFKKAIIGQNKDRKLVREQISQIYLKHTLIAN